MNLTRVWVSGGEFIDTIDLGTSYYSAPYPEPYPLFTLAGEPVNGSYRGPGAIIVRDGARWLVLGDPHGTTWLEEYRVADKPRLSEEQRADREDYRAGFAAGVDRHRTRKKPNAPYAWREGWKEGRLAIGRTP